MSVLPVGFSVPPVLDTIQPLSGASSVAHADFTSMFDGAVSGLNGNLLRAETGLQNLATGNAKSIHEVMIGIEDAKLQLQLIMQMRNRVLEAYQDLMRTQV